MKLKSVLNLVLVFIFAQVLFSCNSAKYYEFSAHKQAPYHHLKQKPAPEATPTLSEVALAAAEEKAEQAEAAPQLEASAAVAPVAPAKKTAPKAIAPKVTAAEAVAPVGPAVATALTDAERMALAKEKINALSKAEKKELKKEIRENLRQRREPVSTALKIILCFIPFIGPPLAVYLHSGINTRFWLTVILSIFWLPGIIFGILVVTDTI